MTVAVKPCPVKTRDGQHTAGYIVGRVFRKKLKLENKLESPPGWTLEEWLLDMLPRYGVSVIQIHVADAPAGQNLLVASLQSFALYGLDVDRGTGLHRALAEGYWKEISYYKLF